MASFISTKSHHTLFAVIGVVEVNYGEEAKTAEKTHEIAKINPAKGTANRIISKRNINEGIKLQTSSLWMYIYLYLFLFPDALCQLLKKKKHYNIV